MEKTHYFLHKTADKLRSMLSVNCKTFYYRVMAGTMLCWNVIENVDQTLPHINDTGTLLRMISEPSCSLTITKRIANNDVYKSKPGRFVPKLYVTSYRPPYEVIYCLSKCSRLDKTKDSIEEDTSRKKEPFLILTV